MRLFKSNTDSLLAAFIGMAVVLLLTKHSGLGLSPDSIYYMSAADSFLSGKGFYQFDNKPFVMFPIFYPFVLSIIKLGFGKTFLLAAPYFNAILFGCLIYLSGVMLEKTNHVKWVKWLVLLIIIFSPSLLEIYTMLWSETLFITEVLLFIWVSEKYFVSYSTKHLLLMAIVAAIAADTRLAGVSIIATGGILILLSYDLKWSKKIKHAFIFGIISISLFVINLIRNANLSQTLTGNRQKGVTPFIENLKYYGLVLSDWLPFSKWTNSFPVILGFIFLLLIGGIFLYRLFKRIEHNSYEKIAATFTLMYSLFMLTVATVSRFETMNNRLLSPFYIPCLFTISFYLVSTLKWVASRNSKIVLTTVLVFVGLATILQYTTLSYNTYKENNEGGIGGYSDDDWRILSGLLAYLDTNPSIFHNGQIVYSNAAHAVYLRTSQHVQILPERKYQNLVDSFNQTPSEILIWFNNEDNPEVLTLQEVATRKNLQILSKFNDGVVYLCTSK